MTSKLIELDKHYPECKIARKLSFPIKIQVYEQIVVFLIKFPIFGIHGYLAFVRVKCLNVKVPCLKINVDYQMIGMPLGNNKTGKIMQKFRRMLNYWECVPFPLKFKFTNKLLYF